MADVPDDLTISERELANDFLKQALDSLLAIGDQHNNPPRMTTEPGDVRKTAAAVYAYRQKILRDRLSSARNAVLFAAIAVEAAVNYYAAVVLASADLSLLEKHRTVHELLLAPRLAGRDALFVAGEQPLTAVQRLFTLRNRIVHPTVGPKSVAQLNSDDFTPARAREHLVEAARAVAMLRGDIEPGVEHRDTAHFILEHEDQLRGLAKAWDDPPNAPNSPAERFRKILLATRSYDVAAPPAGRAKLRSAEKHGPP